MSDLIHIVYVSVSSERLSEKYLDDFLSAIRKRNKQRRVTGLLLYNDEFFIQVIEGSKETIHNLFEIIKNDSRHSNIVKLLEESIESRSFPDWSMGYRKINQTQTDRIPGFSNCMQTDQPDEIISGTTEELMYLLNSFRKHT